MQDSAEMFRKSKDKQFTYTGEPICVVGSMDMNVKHNGQVATLPLIVTPGEGPSFAREELVSINEVGLATDMQDKY